MVERKIEFRQVRDFGENLGDTFQFLRQEGKPFFKSFFAICGVFMLLTAVLSGIFQADIFSGFPGGTTFGKANPFAMLLSGTYFLTILSSFLTQASLHTCVFVYVKAYIGNGNKSPDIDQVWQLFKKYIIKVFLYITPIFLLTIIGFLFCLIPGFYFVVVLAPFAMILVYEDIDFGSAFGRCTYLSKDNYWQSFGIYFISGIIYYVAQLFIGGSVTAIAGLVAYFTTDDLSSVVQVVTSFFSAFSYCFYVIFLLAVAFNYFTLVEKKDGIGILNRIDSIGQSKTNTDSGEEEY